MLISLIIKTVNIWLGIYHSILLGQVPILVFILCLRHMLLLHRCSKSVCSSCLFPLTFMNHLRSEDGKHWQFYQMQSKNTLINALHMPLKACINNKPGVRMWNWYLLLIFFLCLCWKWYWESCWVILLKDGLYINFTETNFLPQTTKTLVCLFFNSNSWKIISASLAYHITIKL